MKLKTKFQDKDFDFGEIVGVTVTTYYAENKVVVMADRARGGVSRFEYNSIKDFIDHWTDVPEEPKEHFVITCDGEIITTAEEFTAINECEEIGNKFETKEEAEKAVEKLKAWKRLKDRGFRFIDHIDRDSGQGMARYEWDGYVNGEDLDLLFEGEE